MGEYVHAPRQSNSTYVHMARRSIHKTRWPEHPHSPIFRYEKRPQRLHPRLHYMESLLDTALLYTTYTSTAMSTAMSTSQRVSVAVTITVITAPLSQEPSHCHIRYRTLAPSSASTVMCWQPFLTGFDSLVFYLIRLNCGFNLIRLNYFSLIRFDSRQMYLFSIWVKQFKSHSSPDSGIPHFPGCLQIFQHWSCGIFHNSNNWN